MANSTSKIHVDDEIFDSDLDIKIEEEDVDEEPVYDGDPDWLQHFMTNGEEIPVDLVSSSDSEKGFGKQRYKHTDLTSAVLDINSKRLTLSEAARTHGVPMSAIRGYLKKITKGKTVKGTPALVKVNHGRKHKSDINSIVPDIERKKRLCILIEESEKVDTEEIAALSDIYHCLQNLLKKQDEACKLLENRCKTSGNNL
ncbi:hypothetical protein SK128_010447 [Halocaridina rubra]|uniref:HTH psq-type domain-containing protein n=1 Tax=Halocaridina rubra TaxID=373956 RepID=A0AAN9A8D1_HALRR